MQLRGGPESITLRIEHFDGIKLWAVNQGQQAVGATIDRHGQSRT
jgi:hypothetical protein